ncbi:MULTISPECIES: hypothetical protein [Rhodococcus]|jgi:hypothetical protein|uniref:Uncharacterized protein n=1 Tax=Rhodococcus rhodochrous TaxID=1829 RepID=A0AAW4XNU8_RHORH|nr:MULTISPECIES: hypothetical protein [Rhodococcus]MCD2114663.1 hypothetical protein [Rhodococcus rhodochrous]QHG84391.1 hypothetical protein D1O33_22380 [Rhodococcus rhodochrous]QOH55872.1 hypothetical protein C6Y44_07775 [Rhodococcus rhodochrous]UPK63575.1 hypothetical protein MYP14_23230 [Rhodococcus pyridinivorans]
MKKFIGTLAAAATLATGTVVLTAPAAQAATISGSAVEYVFCSANQHNNEVTYYDRYGMVEKIVSLPDFDGKVYCGAIEVGIESDSYVWSSIANDHSHYVYAAIYSVSYPLFSGSTGAPPNRTLVAREESRDRSGGFNYAIAS